jgi:beta-lactamase class A
LTTQNQNAIAQIDKEAQARIDQSCLRQEREYKDAVFNLQSTYDYLLKLSPAEKKSTLNQTIIAGLPRTEKNAQLAQAPAYCDKPGVGLSESKADSPPIPKRPASLNG